MDSARQKGRDHLQGCNFNTINSNNHLPKPILISLLSKHVTSPPHGAFPLDTGIVDLTWSWAAYLIMYAASPARGIPGFRYHYYLSLHMHLQTLGIAHHFYLGRYSVR